MQLVSEIVHIIYASAYDKLEIALINVLLSTTDRKCNGKGMPVQKWPSKKLPSACLMPSLRTRRVASANVNDAPNLTYTIAVGLYRKPYAVARNFKPRGSRRWFPLFAATRSKAMLHVHRAQSAVVKELEMR